MPRHPPEGTFFSFFIINVLAAQTHRLEADLEKPRLRSASCPLRGPVFALNQHTPPASAGSRGPRPVLRRDACLGRRRARPGLPVSPPGARRLELDRPPQGGDVNTTPA